MDCCSLFDGVSPSRLGYGGMRFPIVRETGAIDEVKTKELIDRAIRGGITYFDTAWPYHNGESEPFLGRVLSAYPRENFWSSSCSGCRRPMWTSI